MIPIKVRTERRHSYAGKVHPQGDEYYIDNKKHLAFLVAIKKVKPAETQVIKKITLVNKFENTPSWNDSAIKKSSRKMRKKNNAGHK